MKEKYRAQERIDRDRDATNRREDEHNDEPTPTRKLYERPPLTKREQQERWPIG